MSFNNLPSNTYYNQMDQRFYLIEKKLYTTTKEMIDKVNSINTTIIQNNVIDVMNNYTEELRTEVNNRMDDIQKYIEENMNRIYLILALLTYIKGTDIDLETNLIYLLEVFNKTGTTTTYPHNIPHLFNEFCRSITDPNLGVNEVTMVNDAFERMFQCISSFFGNVNYPLYRELLYVSQEFFEISRIFCEKYVDTSDGNNTKNLFLVEVTDARNKLNEIMSSLSNYNKVNLF
jgi:hypothetical protein